MAPIGIAGNLVPNPLGEILAYVAALPRTVDEFDGVAGTSPLTLTPSLVVATRIVSSRVSNAELSWVVGAAANAPWHLVKPTDNFTAANPLVVGGVYDAALALWDYFWTYPKPRGFAVAKLSKILYLMRPRCFPIVDSRIAKRYRKSARDLKPAIYAARPVLRGSDGLTWEAFRRDLIAATPQLKAVRKGLLATGRPREAMVAKNVSDVRLLDMIAWRLG